MCYLCFRCVLRLFQSVFAFSPSFSFAVFLSVYHSHIEKLTYNPIKAHIRAVLRNRVTFKMFTVPKELAKTCEHIYVFSNPKFKLVSTVDILQLYDIVLSVK